MKNLFLKLAFGFLLGFTSMAIWAMEEGIYLTSDSVEDTPKLNHFIEEAKKVGIGTFVVDVDGQTKKYSQNIPLIKKNGLRYVARIVVFPHGGNVSQVKSEAYWEKRWKQIAYALSLGADAIQLDYIRYTSKDHKASPQNQNDIRAVLTYFKNKLKAKHIPLQADIFGTIAYKTETGIGQDVATISSVVDGINPMVYPSHFAPHALHSATPYLTVSDSIQHFKQEISNRPNVKINAFIEVYNFRYPMEEAKHKRYIQAEILGARDGGADGWYFWSANNKYDILFSVLKGTSVNTMKETFKAAEAPLYGKKFLPKNNGDLAKSKNKTPQPS